MSHSAGRKFEQTGCEWLKNKGLKFISANYHCRGGEIDLIMLDGNTLCFIEVKFRKNSEFGGAAYSISRQKQQRLQQCALHYLSHHKKQQKLAMRFDALLLLANPATQTVSVEWIKNAFEAGQDYF